MNGLLLQKYAAGCAEKLPGSSVEQPFGPDWDVFKVRGKVFMLLTDVPGRPIVILKSDPTEAQALRQQNANITAGYHMNKKHWITLEGGAATDAKLINELVTESYLLVVGNLPKSQRPVDPHTYGHSTLHTHGNQNLQR